MNNEKKSGITIHYLDNDYDTGKIIFQKEVKISKLDSVEDIGHVISDKTNLVSNLTGDGKQ